MSKNQIPREPRESKPVETMNLVAVESGRLQPLGCNQFTKIMFKNFKLI